MSRNYYNILINSEKIKIQKTQKEIPGFYEFLPILFNVLLQMPFCTGKLCDENDIEMVKIQDLFQFFIYDTSFKVKNIIYLMEIGSYCDACILFRSLLESFIIYKYFILSKDGSGLSKYFETDRSKRSKQRIKDIFEKVIPNFYDDLYDELCMNTHSNPLIQAIFRGNVSKNEPIKSRIDNINIDWFSYIANQLLPLIIGIIDLYKYVYPNNTLENNKQLKHDLDTVYKFIYDDIEERKIEFPNQLKMIEYYNQIIKIKSLEQ